MAGPIIALIAVLTGAGSALLGPPKAWDRVDPTVHKKIQYKPAKVEYFSTESSPERAKNGDCTFTIYAYASRNRLTRVRFNGVEQNLDWSYHAMAKARDGSAVDTKIEFIDPVTRKSQTHTVHSQCWAKVSLPSGNDW